MPTPTRTTSPLLDKLRPVDRPTATPVTDSDAIHLLVARESSRYAGGLVWKMVRYVCGIAHKAGVPGAAEMLEASGEAPRDFVPFERSARGEAWRAAHGAVPLLEEGGRIYGWYFEIVPGTYVLIAAASATSTSQEDLRNPFTRDLQQILNTRNIDHLWTGPASRLMRRRHHAASLGETLRRQRVTVHPANLAAIDFRTSPAIAGQLWQTAAEFSHQEVTSILSRLFLGRLGAITAGGWPEGDSGIPAIHLTKDEDGILVPDPSKRPFVEALVSEAAAAKREGLSLTTEVAAQIASAVDAATDPDGGDGLTDLTDALGAVERRLSKLVTAAEGRYERTQQLPDPTWTEDEVLQPVYEDENGNRMIHAVWTFPTLLESFDLDPDKVKTAVEWASQVLGEDRPSETLEDRLPLAETRVVIEQPDDPDLVWSLTREGNRYLVREHPAGTAPRGEGVDSRIVRSYPWRELHPAIVDAVARCADDDTLSIAATGSDSRKGAAPTARTPEQARLDAHIADLRREVDDLRSTGDRLSPELREEVLAELRPQIDQLESDIQEAESRLEERDALHVEPALADDETVATLADLLALLEVTGPMSPELRRLVRRFIAEIRFDAPANELPTATGSVRLQLATDDGVRLTEPIPWTATTSQKGYRKVGKTVYRDRKQRIERPAALHARCTTNAAPGELLVCAEGTARTHLLELLTGGVDAYPEPALTPRAASALIDVGPTSTRTAVYALLGHAGRLPWHGHSWDDGNLPEVPPLPTRIEDLDEQQTTTWLAHLKLIYLGNSDESSPGRGWSDGGERLRRSIVRTIAALGGSVPAPEMGRRMGLQNPLDKEHQARSIFGRYDDLVTVLPDGTGGAVLNLVACPWADCGYDGGLHPLNVLEVPSGVLCPDCHRSPEQADVVFPASSFEEWEGPTRAMNRDLSDLRPDDAVGTWLSTNPAPVLSPVTTVPVAVGSGTNACGWRPTEDQEPCEALTATARTSYCAEHRDRSVRAQLTVEAKVAQGCRFPGCRNALSWGGVGRPPEYCQEQHGDPYERRKLLAAMGR